MKTFTELGITEEQYKNIAKLIIFVKDKVAPPKFNISNYYGGNNVYTDYPIQAKYECGTTACFCGYGPLAGIKPLKDELWQDYAGRCFSANNDADLDNKNIFRLLFDVDHINDKIAAVKRGAYFLQYGLPSTTYDFMLENWEVPDNFRPQWKKIKAIAES